MRNLKSKNSKPEEKQIKMKRTAAKAGFDINDVKKIKKCIRFINPRQKHFSRGLPCVYLFRLGTPSRFPQETRAKLPVGQTKEMWKFGLTNNLGKRFYQHRTTFGKHIRCVTWRLVAVDSLQEAENYIRMKWTNKIVSKTALFSEVVTVLSQTEIEKVFDEAADLFGVFRATDSRIKLIERMESAEKRVKYLEEELERTRRMTEKRTEQLIQNYQDRLSKV